MRNLDDHDWETLLDRIQTTSCTPFLGAGVNYGFLPTGTEIARRWADEYGYPLPECGDLARVAQFVAIDRGDWILPKDKILREFRMASKEQDFASPDNPLAVLAELPLPVYITTNYDNYMFQALRFKAKEPRLELCRWNSIVAKRWESVLERKSRYSPTPEQPVVFHLHGHQSMVESLVLTEDDYLDFLVNISRQKQVLPRRIEEALTGSSLLFIGYKLADWDFRVLLHGLVNATEKALRRLSVSVQLPPEVGDQAREKAQAFLDRYFGEIQVRVFWGTAREFAQRLRDLWERSRAAMADRP